MTPEQQLRREILMQLYASRPLKMSASLMARQARQWGLSEWTTKDFVREAEFLVGQGLVERFVDPISGEVQYRITSNGVLRHEESFSDQ